MNPSHLQSSPKITPWMIIHQFFPIQPLSSVDQALSINEWCVITPTANIKYQPYTNPSNFITELQSSQNAVTSRLSNSNCKVLEQRGSNKLQSWWSIQNGILTTGRAMARLDPQPPSQKPSPQTEQIPAAKFLDCTGVMMGSVRGCVSSICTSASASP